MYGSAIPIFFVSLRQDFLSLGERIFWKFEEYCTAILTFTRNNLWHWLAAWIALRVDWFWLSRSLQVCLFTVLTSASKFLLWFWCFVSRDLWNNYLFLIILVFQICASTNLLFVKWDWICMIPGKSHTGIDQSEMKSAR